MQGSSQGHDSENGLFQVFVCQVTHYDKDCPTELFCLESL